MYNICNFLLKTYKYFLICTDFSKNGLKALKSLHTNRLNKSEQKIFDTSILFLSKELIRV